MTPTDPDHQIRPRALDHQIRPRALVTGGAVRVGRAIALALAGAGMDVVIGYHRSAADARRTVADLTAAGARAVALRADLRNARAAGRLAAAAARALGGLDVLVNSASLFSSTPVGTATPARYDDLFAVNTRAAFFCTQAAVARMADGGHVVNVSDVITSQARPGWSAYTASKAALEALTRSLAVELRPRGISVNCVAPGPVLKPERLPLARWRQITRDHAGSPADVAAAVVFFATCPRYVTGQVLRVDGAATA
ncbi:MAG TPA: SDR family NAD(P)-dependent oxidoreductase [Methylomirabilota bacterium]|nr:SDR family NAD(P)-dependent oxidoreductase [Methylomirabilota bacterium]